MKHIQTPLRVPPEWPTVINDADDKQIAAYLEPEIAAEIVRRCNEYEALQSQLLAQEAAVSDAWNAEREELKLRAESAEAKLAEVPQLVAALKQIRTTAEKQIRTRLAGMYGWKTETIDKCVEDNELIQQLDAAIAAGEGRDAERS